MDCIINLNLEFVWIKSNNRIIFILDNGKNYFPNTINPTGNAMIKWFNNTKTKRALRHRVLKTKRN